MTKCGKFQESNIYCSSVIKNQYFAHKYFLSWNQGYDSIYLIFRKIKSSNLVKLYIFGMLTSSRVIWYITHRDWMILKIWPHLTLDRKWPHNSITDDKKYQKLYIFGILVVSGVVWGITRGGQTILKIWPHLTSPVTPIYKMTNWSKNCQNVVCYSIALKPPLTHFSQNGF